MIKEKILSLLSKISSLQIFGIGLKFSPSLALIPTFAWLAPSSRSSATTAPKSPNAPPPRSAEFSSTPFSASAACLSQIRKVQISDMVSYSFEISKYNLPIVRPTISPYHTSSPESYWSQITPSALTKIPVARLKKWSDLGNMCSSCNARSLRFYANQLNLSFSSDRMFGGKK